MSMDVSIGGRVVAAEVTLSNRDEMGFRMLIGREALRGGFLVDPGRVLPRRPAAGRRTPQEPGALMARDSFAIGNVRVRAGAARGRSSCRSPGWSPASDVSLPVRIVHGREDGPTIWVNAAIHGDEVVGVEVIRQVIADLDPKDFRGTLIAVPIVNVLGFMTGDRYLPDRRDLNRSFPGSPRGSLASRIAHLFMREVVAKCEVGIDLHTGADRRSNLPQVRADLDDPRTRELAEAFARAGDAAREDPRRLAAARRPRARRQRAALRGRGEPALRRLRDRRRRRRGPPRARRPRHDRPPHRAGPPAERGVPLQRLGPRPTYRHPRPRRPARPAGRPTASGSAPSSTPSAARCGWSTPTATAS